MESGRVFGGVFPEAWRPPLAVRGRRRRGGEEGWRRGRGGWAQGIEDSAYLLPTNSSAKEKGEGGGREKCHSKKFVTATVLNLSSVSQYSAELQNLKLTSTAVSKGSKNVIHPPAPQGAGTRGRAG